MGLPLLPVARGAAALVAALLLAPVHAQPNEAHEVRYGDLTLRSSSVLSQEMDPIMADRYGIQAAPDRAVLKVLLLRGTAPARETVPADVRAASRNLAAMRQVIALREVREDGRVFYLGSFRFLPNEELDFHVRATRLGSGGPELSLTYSERMPGVQAR